MHGVSCLCVSRPSRYGQLQRAIIDFAKQVDVTKELVIVVDNSTDYAAQVQSFVDTQRSLSDDLDVQVIARPLRSQLEGLAYAAAYASHDILTLWDDDNLNHPERLACQVINQKQRPKAITVLSEAGYIFWPDDELFIVNVADPESPVASRTIPSSLMAYRRYFPPLEPNLRSRPCEVMLSNAAKAGRKIDSLSISPVLHLVGVTRNNLRTYEYHRRIAQERSRDVAWLKNAEIDLTQALRRMPWNGKLFVEGRDGSAFEFTPTLLWENLHPIKLTEDNSADPDAPVRTRPTTTSVTGSSLRPKEPDSK